MAEPMAVETPRRGRNGRGEMLEHALLLVRALEAHRFRGLTVSELAAELGLGRRSTYRWLVEAQRLLPVERCERVGETVRYRLAG